VPRTSYASSGPGQGGIVAPIAASGPAPVDRNWKCVPAGMLQGHGLLPLGLAPPHLPLPAQDVPDLFDGMVGHRPGDPADSQLEMGHPAAAELQQNPDGRTIGRDNISCLGKLHGVKISVHDPSALRPG
jgi:hypothetical protein